jgi:phosphoserine / homoserine phosphotransferase
MQILCLDLEGVLVPEIWIAFAEKTGVDALRRTTRDEPDYDVLMRYRLEALDAHGFTLPQIQEVIAKLEPLPGALAFVEQTRQWGELIILSDTFTQFAGPLIKQLGHPTLFCHELVVETEGRIADYRLRAADHKTKTVQALQGLNFEVIAAGDSYNDLGMLDAADHAILFRPPESLVHERPDIPVTREHDELFSKIKALAP